MEEGVQPGGGMGPAQGEGFGGWRCQPLLAPQPPTPLLLFLGAEFSGGRRKMSHQPPRRGLTAGGMETCKSFQIP